jgi:methyl-accepting chemotaxis protein
MMGQFAILTRSLAEQSQAAQEITGASSSLTHQAAEAKRSLEEQARSLKQMAGGASAVSKHIKTIASSNKDNSQSAVVIAERLLQVRGIARENLQEGKGIASLLGQNIKPVVAGARAKGRPAA